MIRKRFLPKDPSRSLPPGLSWFVLQTKPNREFHVQHRLEDAGWTTMIPLNTRWVVNRKRGGREYKKRNVKRAVQYPLIPRTVLIGGHLFPWFDIMNNQHVTGVLGIGGTPQPMRPGEAEALQRASKALLVEPSGKKIMPASRAKFVGPGPFNGHVIEIRDVDGPYATTIQNWFGSERIVKVKLDELEPM